MFAPGIEFLCFSRTLSL